MTAIPIRLDTMEPEEEREARPLLDDDEEYEDISEDVAEQLRLLLTDRRTQ